MMVSRESFPIFGVVLLQCLAMVSGAPASSDLFAIFTDTAESTCSSNHFKSSNGSCIECLQCSSDQETLQKCGADLDTVCGCRSGFFMDISQGKCRKCRACPVGSILEDECTGTSDTRCSSCPQGNFLDETDNVCKQCTVCSTDQVVLQNCNSTADAVCLAFGFAKPKPKSSDGPQSRYPKHADNSLVKKKTESRLSAALDSMEREKFSPIFLVPFCFIITVSLLYWGLKTYENRTRRLLICAPSCPPIRITSRPTGCTGTATPHPVTFCTEVSIQPTAMPKLPLRAPPTRIFANHPQGLPSIHAPPSYQRSLLNVIGSHGDASPHNRTGMFPT